jgi:hypothetical protein
MYCAGDVSLETACEETVYYTSKIDWLRSNLANIDWEETVSHIRDLHADGDYVGCVAFLDHHITGLSYVKAGFTLAMAGMWEVACPDSRTRQELGIESRIRSESDYRDALQQIDETVPIEAPLFIKQWVLYDSFAGEHARHMPFFTEVFKGEKWR